TGSIRFGMEFEYDFASEDQLLDHFARHGWEGGAETPEEYLTAANQFFEGGEGVETATFEGSGDTAYYNEATKEFGVLTQDNIIKTYFTRELDEWLELIGEL